MRSCNGCDRCCDGHLEGTARGTWFGKLKPCKFLADTLCTIYDARPSQCRKYYCAWAQELLPIWMKPSEIDVVVSVEIDQTNKQYLKVVSTNDLTTEVENEINSWVTENNTYFVKNKIIPILLERI